MGCHPQKDEEKRFEACFSSIDDIHNYQEIRISKRTSKKMSGQKFSPAVSAILKSLYNQNKNFFLVFVVF
jgi:hypothetical protein